MSSNEHDFFGGFFDIDGDGATSVFEEFIAYKIFEETIPDENDCFDEDESDDFFDDINPEDGFLS